MKCTIISVLFIGLNEIQNITWKYYFPSPAHWSPERRFKNIRYTVKFIINMLYNTTTLLKTQIRDFGHHTINTSPQKYILNIIENIEIKSWQWISRGTRYSEFLVTRSNPLIDTYYTCLKWFGLKLHRQMPQREELHLFTSQSEYC